MLCVSASPNGFVFVTWILLRADIVAELGATWKCFEYPCVVARDDAQEARAITDGYFVAGISGSGGRVPRLHVRPR